MVDCGTSMPSMHSMRWDFFPVIKGPCKRYAVTLTRMPVHNCFPGPHSAASMQELPCIERIERIERMGAAVESIW
jgi:hypothetical protein